MGEEKKSTFKSTDTINASEIGQFSFCSVSWYLQKCGYKPKSDFIDIGSKKHIDLGRAIDRYETNMKKSNFFKYFGYLLVFIGCLIFLFEVIL